MNTQAVFKTLVVVLAIGALTGYHEWRTVEGAPPEVRAQRDIAQCIKDRQEASYRENPLKFGHYVTQENEQIEADCRAQQSGGLQLGKNTGQAKPNASGTVKVGGQHYFANGQWQTQSREECLARLDAARKRSRIGLNPEWEQHEKEHCATFYSEAEDK